MLTKSSKKLIKTKNDLKINKKTPTHISKLSVIVALLLIAFVIPIFTLTANAASGTILINTSTLSGTVTSTNNGVSTIKTAMGTLKLSDVKGSTDSAVNYSLIALAVSIISLIVLLAIAVRTFRKTN